MFGPPRSHSSVPARTNVKPSRAGAVKVGRRLGFEARFAVSKPHLDGPEHGGRLMCAGIAGGCLEVDRRQIAKRGVAATRIVPALDELEDRETRISEPALAFAAQYAPGFPGVREVIARHTLHVLISIAAESHEHADRFRDASFVTVAAEAACRAVPSLAVLWLAADRLTPADTMISRATEFEGGDVPVLVWCNALPLRLTDPATGIAKQSVMTRGLQAFLGYRSHASADLRTGWPAT